MSTYNWYYKPFAELTPHELYAIMHLRSEVFVVEQNCVYLDADGKDLSSWHLMGWDGTQLVAYCRLLPAGLAFTEVSIGRVVVDESYRGTGLGHEIMKQSMLFIKEQYGDVDVRLSAQKHLENYYGRHDFRSTGKEYLEDGIPHVEMLYKF